MNPFGASDSTGERDTSLSHLTNNTPIKKQKAKKVITIFI